LVGKRVIVITSGGGGIPVIKQPNGELVGIEAVIDKDMAGMKLAEVVDGDIFLVLTDVDNVFINYGQEKEKAIHTMTIEEAKQYLSEGQFLEGSMAPKVRACIAFVENGGERAIITSINNAVSALKSESGTEIVLN
jgi:carbamate kinase